MIREPLIRFRNEFCANPRFHPVDIHQIEEDLLKVEKRLGAAIYYQRDRERETYERYRKE